MRCVAFARLVGEPIFDSLARHPDESAVFNEGMTGFSSSIAPAVAEAHDFGAFGTVVDVGGGRSVLLKTILRAYPGVNGIVFDAPHVIVGAEDAIREAGLAGCCRAVGGDSFRGVPAGADAVPGLDDDRSLPFPFLRDGMTPSPMRDVRVRAPNDCMKIAGRSRLQQRDHRRHFLVGGGSVPRPDVRQASLRQPSVRRSNRWVAHTNRVLGGLKGRQEPSPG